MYSTWCAPGNLIRYCYRDYSEYETQDLIFEYFMVSIGLAGMALISAIFSGPAATIVGIIGLAVGAVGAYINKIDNQGHNRGIYIGMIQYETPGYWWWAWHSGKWFTTWEWLGAR